MTSQTYPKILQTVLDATDPRRLAEFYRQLFGLPYRGADETPSAGDRPQQEAGTKPGTVSTDSSCSLSELCGSWASTGVPEANTLKASSVAGVGGVQPHGQAGKPIGDTHRPWQGCSLWSSG